MTTSNEIEAQKQVRLDWIRRVYNSDAEAISQTASDEHLLDNTNFDLKMFIDTYRPLTKLKEARGDLDFRIENVRHEHPDVTFVDLYLDDEHIFEAYVRFESEHDLFDLFLEPGHHRDDHDQDGNPQRHPDDGDQRDDRNEGALRFQVPQR